MRLVTAVAVLVVAALFSPPLARAEMKAQEILWDCATPEDNATNERQLKFVMCLSYLAGANDMMSLAAGLLSTGLYCPPEGKGISGDQLRRMVLKWIEGHPEAMHEPARDAVFRTLMEAFRCKKPSTAERPPRKGAK
jgi:Rap1a immunity proteins